jgi:hypothetical protein
MNLSPVLHDQCDPTGDLLTFDQRFYAFVDSRDPLRFYGSAWEYPDDDI